MSEPLLAFIHAHRVLTWLQEQGVTASATLYADGSGRLTFNEEVARHLSPEVIREVEQALHSTRWESSGSGVVAISSCRGWHP